MLSHSRLDLRSLEHMQGHIQLRWVALNFREILGCCLLLVLASVMIYPAHTQGHKLSPWMSALMRCQQRVEDAEFTWNVHDHGRCAVRAAVHG